MINGLVTVKVHIPSFITTLGMTFAVEGVILIGSNGAPANPVGTGTSHWSWVGATWAETYLGTGPPHSDAHRAATERPSACIPSLSGGTWSRPESRGSKSTSVKIWCFVVCSMIGGLIGILDGYHIGSIDPDTNGLSFMFYGVSAAVIGGTALTGGRGTMIGACIGAIVLGVLEDGFHVISISSFAYDLILGLAIVFAMILNVQIERAGLRRRGSFARAVNLIFARRRKAPVP